jgi:hypothetical protein
MTALASGVSAVDQGVRKGIRILLDGGSDLSFIRDEVAQELGLPQVGEGVFACVGFQEKKEAARKYRKVQLILEPRHGGPPVSLFLYATGSLCAPLVPRTVPSQREILHLPLADDFGGGPIDVIIGSDQFYQVVGQGSVALSSKLRAVETVFGYVVHGQGDGAVVPMVAPRMCNISTLWDLESMGIEPDMDKEGEVVPKPRWDPEQKRMCVGLLWRGEERPANNYGHARARFRTMEAKLSSATTALYEEYMTLNMRDGVIRRSLVAWKEEKEQFFLPHRALTEPKFRPIFDGSAPDGVGKSLNSYLSPGPNLLPHLLEVLIRFRSGMVGLTLDCKQAFHQVLVEPEDSRFLQLLWREGAFCFNRLVMGVTCSPACLHAALTHLLSLVKEKPEIVARLEKGLYVDDLVCSFRSTEEAAEAVRVANRIFGAAGVQLHKMHNTGDQAPPTKTLGVMWDTRRDTLSPVFPSVSSPPTTRKQLLSLVNRIWDPLGLISCWTVTGRMIFQAAWTLTKGWDERLPEDLLRRAEVFMAEMKDAPGVTVPRAAFLGGSCELEAFCDASSKAYTAVVYSVKDGARVLVVAKTRLAPLSGLSIPRLELMAALVSVRLVKSVIKSLGLEDSVEIRYYSDSQDVLYWLQERKPLKKFVKNRVSEILESSSVEQWFWVPTHLNPADRGTRGVRLSELQHDDLWWSGPPSDAEMHTVPFSSLHPSEEARREESKEEPSGVPTASVAYTHEEPRRSTPLLDIGRFSSLKKLLSVTAYCLRFIRNLRRSREEREALEKTRYPSAEELMSARNYWIRDGQEEGLPVQDLESGRIPGNLVRLRLFMGPDRAVRVVELTLQGERTRRPVQKLYCLEAAVDESLDDEPTLIEDEEDEPPEDERTLTEEAGEGEPNGEPTEGAGVPTVPSETLESAREELRTPRTRRGRQVVRPARFRD